MRSWVTLSLLLLVVTFAWAREHRRIIIEREMLQRAHFYKYDCESQGTLVHCKDMWFEIDGFKLADHH
jgi:hypothetical protein